MYIPGHILGQNKNKVKLSFFVFFSSSDEDEDEDDRWEEDRCECLKILINLLKTLKNVKER